MKRLYIVGTGPGDLEHLTPAARAAIEASSDLVAYGLYIDLLGVLAASKSCHRLPLGEEIPRAKQALDLASTGRITTLLSSGDAGIYAMATVVFELLDNSARPEWSGIEVQVIPGISALQAVAARVGAPLSHDFCTISLSDLLTPWDIIENRIDAAGRGDFVIAFYNPVSRRRHWQLEHAVEILMRYRSGDTPTVVARNITRPGETVELSTLGALRPERVDMLSLVLVGNRETKRFGDSVYTPRGYARKHNGNTHLTRSSDATKSMKEEA